MEKKYYQVVSGTGISLEVAANVRYRDPIWVICLHGIQSNKALFDDLLQQDFLDPFSVMALDLIGFGDSSKPADFSYDIAEQAHIVGQVLRTLDAKAFHLIGHSLGGMVATLLLQPLIGVVRSFVNLEGNLVLSDCGLSKDVIKQPFQSFQSNRQYEVIKSSIKSSDEPGAANRAVWLQSVPDYAFYKSCESIVRWASTGKLLQMFVDAPIHRLFICGSRNTGKIECLPDTIATAIIAQSGHFMLQSNPKDSYQAIQRFLTQPPDPIWANRVR